MEQPINDLGKEKIPSHKLRKILLLVKRQHTYNLQQFK